MSGLDGDVDEDLEYGSEFAYGGITGMSKPREA